MSVGSAFFPEAVRGPRPGRRRAGAADACWGRLGPSSCVGV